MTHHTAPVQPPAPWPGHSSTRSAPHPAAARARCPSAARLGGGRQPPGWVTVCLPKTKT